MNDETLNNLKYYTLLFVENEKGTRDNYQEVFDLLFKKVFVAKDGLQALDLFKKNSCDIIITDIKMPNMDGIELVKEIRKTNKDISIVIISAYTDEELLLSSIPLNLIEYIVKPLSEKKLFEVFDAFLSKQDSLCKFNFNKNKSEISFDNVKYELTLKECMLINKLINSQNIITYEEIQNDIWQENIMSQNALRLFMKNLRKKLPVNTIKNISNQGYMLNRNKIL